MKAVPQLFLTSLSRKWRSKKKRGRGETWLLDYDPPQGHDEVEQVEHRQRDEELVKVGPHLGAGEHEHGEDVA